MIESESMWDDACQQAREDQCRRILGEVNQGTEVIERSDGAVFIRKDVVIRAMMALLPK